MQLVSCVFLHSRVSLMAEPGGLSFEDACALGDLVLELPALHGEQEKRCIRVHRSQVILASSILRHMLVDEQGSADEGEA